VERDLRRVTTGSQRQEDCLAEVLNHVGIKPAIGEWNRTFVDVSSEIFWYRKCGDGSHWPRQIVKRYRLGVRRILVQIPTGGAGFA
jgi:hypothetical protein